MSGKAPAGGASRRATAIGELLRFALVGVLNTAFGYAIFWLGLKVLGLSPQWANTLGYAVSLCLAFVLTRHFVFGAADAAPARHAAGRFLLAFGVAFAINQAVLWRLLRSAWRPEIAQLGAMVAYTAVFFILNKFFVFNRNRAAPSNP